MDEPDKPQDEALRIATLQSLDVLDTPPEERFDRLTRMAKRIFNVPIALVSLVDVNRQWFKSCVGLDASETPRNISFCGHAILGDEIFVITDASKDVRFADNPLVTGEPNIRFYAGCPLSMGNGTKMGTLCVIDQKPHYPEKEELEMLRDLATMAERELAAVQLATLDELTNITNRRGFTKLAAHTLKLCARQKIPLSLVFIDLNKFKQINDRFGHAEGDQALITFTELMKNCFRESDLIARLSGDEFIVLLTNTSPELAKDVMARFQSSLDAHNNECNRDYSISFSYGIVAFDYEKHRNVDQLMADGDALMYQHKQQR